MSKYIDMHHGENHPLRCFDCKTLKPREDFPTCDTKKSGRGQICNACVEKRGPMFGKRKEVSLPDFMTCEICSKEKPLSAFVNKKHGRKRARRPVCFDCRNQYAVEHGIAPGKTFKFPNKNFIIDGKKRCSRCREMVAIENFTKNLAAPHGLDWYCKDCNKTNLREYQKRNRKVYWLIRKNNKHIYGDLSVDFLRDLFKSQGKCAYCFVPFTNEAEATLDHIIAIARGGKTTKENVCFACDQCNRAKNTMTGDEFRAWLEALRQRLNAAAGPRKETAKIFSLADYAKGDRSRPVSEIEFDWAERGTGT